MTTALLVVDVQNGFDDPVWGTRNNQTAEENIAAALAAFRDQGKRVIHVRHNSRDSASPLAPGQRGNEIKDIAAPVDGETVINKGVNSAFIGTDLQVRIDTLGVTHLVVVGFTTDHCVSTTVRMGANLGYQMTVIANATATFDRVDHVGRHLSAEEIQTVTLASLHGEFARVIESLDQL